MKETRAKEQQIADALRISKPQYSLYETGKRDIPTEKLAAFCRYYKISADQLLEITDS